MEEYGYDRNDPWDNGIYGTGRTKPPKKRGGLVAVLLVIIIFLGGLVSVLGVLNIKLFKELKNRPKEQEDSISFITETEGENDWTSVEEDVQEETQTVEDTQEEAFLLNPSPEAEGNIVQQGGISLQEIYEKNIESVVSIICAGQNGSGTGTGVIISDNGYIVTNCHVVEGAGSITVKLTDERDFAATLVGADEISDLAVIRIDAADLTPAEFGDSSVLRVGDSVAAIGDPLGVEFRGTLTNGIVSAINRDVMTEGRTLTLIQTNAALNSGNSGGPLINCYGQVIGINTMKISAFVDEAGVEGLGFAIPSSTVKEIVEQLVSQGYVSGRPTLGISGESVSNFYQYYYRMPAGLYITQVDPNSNAAKTGIEEGDILISVGQTRINGPDDLKTALYSYEVGDVVEIIIYRSGQRYSAEIILAESKG